MLSYVNGFGDMGLRERHGGKWWWTLNMEVHGEGGVLVSLLGHMGRVYGRVLGGVGGSYVVTRSLKWVMALRLDFGMIFSVGIWPLKIPF
jgi:voltage-gated potassium channel Kch